MSTMLASDSSGASGVACAGDRGIAVPRLWRRVGL